MGNLFSDRIRDGLIQDIGEHLPIPRASDFAGSLISAEAGPDRDIDGQQ
ncbi:hypothetical protein ACFVH4_28060 [Nocardia ignorata]